MWFIFNGQVLIGPTGFFIQFNQFFLTPEKSFALLLKRKLLFAYFRGVKLHLAGKFITGQRFQQQAVCGFPKLQKIDVNRYLELIRARFLMG